MAQAKIGIRYCGGCNPCYERVEMIQAVQSLAGDRFLFIRYDQQGLDGLITVNGCPRACASKDLSPPGVPCHSVEERGDFDSLVEWLFNLGKKKT